MSNRNSQENSYDKTFVLTAGVKQSFSAYGSARSWLIKESLHALDISINNDSSINRQAGQTEYYDGLIRDFALTCSQDVTVVISFSSNRQEPINKAFDALVTVESINQPVTVVTDPANPIEIVLGAEGDTALSGVPRVVLAPDAVETLPANANRKEAFVQLLTSVDAEVTVNGELILNGVVPAVILDNVRGAIVVENTGLVDAEIKISERV